MSQLALKYSSPAQHHFPQNSVTLVCGGNCDAGDDGADRVILLNGTSTMANWNAAGTRTHEQAEI